MLYQPSTTELLVALCLISETSIYNLNLCKVEIYRFKNMPQNLHLPQFSMAGPGGHQRRDQLSAELRHTWRIIRIIISPSYCTMVLHRACMDLILCLSFFPFRFNHRQCFRPHTQLTYCSNFPGIKVGLYVFMVPAIVSADEMWDSIIFLIIQYALQNNIQY